METKIVNIINEMAEYLDAGQLRMLQVLLRQEEDGKLYLYDLVNIKKETSTPREH